MSCLVALAIVNAALLVHPFPPYPWPESERARARDGGFPRRERERVHCVITDMKMDVLLSLGTSTETLQILDGAWTEICILLKQGRYRSPQSVNSVATLSKPTGLSVQLSVWTLKLRALS